MSVAGLWKRLFVLFLALEQLFAELKNEVCNGLYAWEEITSKSMTEKLRRWAESERSGCVLVFYKAVPPFESNTEMNIFFIFN